MEYAKISSIQLNEPASWQSKLFLTFDIDWACDEVLAETISLVEAADVEATWFVTHPTPLLKRLRDNPKFELGIHPNFNPLLQPNSFPAKSATDIIQELMELVPEAVSVRSHSVSQSSRIQLLFSQAGLKFDCNDFIPFHSGITLQPWLHWNEMLKVPYYWEDDVYMMLGSQPDVFTLLQRKGLKVLDFHPIHVALNSTSMDAYERARPFFQDPHQLKKHMCAGFGIQEYLLAVLSLKTTVTEGSLSSQNAIA